MLKVMSDLIEPHLRHIRAEGLAERTIADRRTVLRRADQDLPMGLNQATVEELADWLAKFRCNQTKATYYGHLKGYYDWACEECRDEGLSWNPMSSLTRPRVPRTAPRPVTDLELAELLEVARDPFRRWIVLAAYAGLRALEIASIERKDITEQTITVRGKGGKSAVLPTHPEVWRVVKELPPGPITRGVHGGRLTANCVSARFGEYCRDKLGRDGITLHRFRHWYGTTTLRQTQNLRVVQELLRHSSPATTAIYTQVTDEERRIAVAALPVLAPASA